MLHNMTNFSENNINHEKYFKYKKRYLNLKNQSRSKTQQGGLNESKFSLIDEIHFWGRQMMEHTLLLFLGLQDNDNDIKKEMNNTQLYGPRRDIDTNGSLKNQAFELFQTWKQFLQKSFYDKEINVTMETVFLTQNDIAKFESDNIPIDNVNELIQNTIKFKTLVVNTLNQNEWIGWIYPALAEHMLQEAEYFNRKVNGPVFTTLEEIQFCNLHHSTEMEATAQLFDPNPAQQAIIDVVRSYALKKMTTLSKEWTKKEEEILQGIAPSEETNMLMLSIRFSEELTEFANETGQKIEKNELKSIISPALAHHIHREFVRFTETLKKLKERTY